MRYRQKPAEGKKKVSSGNKNFIYTLKSFSREHIKLYTLLAYVKGRLLSSFHDEDPMKKALDYPEDFLIFETSKFRTIFRPKYRLAAVNLDDPRIFEGLQLSLNAISFMKEKLDQQGVIFCVLLIPTKELVFSQLVNSQNTVNDLARSHYFELIQYEKRMWKITQDYFQTHHVAFIDSLPYFVDILKRDIQPYKQTSDGHPNQFGHKMLAESIYNELLSTLPTKKIYNRK